MIAGYKNFMLFSVLESILNADPEFLTLIKNISIEGDYVAKSLIKLIGDDIKTNINYIKPSEKNDDIKFVNDTQVQRILDAGNDPFDKSINTTKIGRAVRQLLKFNNISFTDVQIENFVNLYKNAWDNKFSKLSEGFSLVKGNSIKKWYLEDNYVPGSGQLNNSCMRQSHKQDFFEIYVQNPEVCQLLILLDDRGLLLGRALLWKLIPGSGKSDYYLDRIYTRFDNDADKFKNWYMDFLKNPDDFSAYYYKSNASLSVQLKNWKFEKYPYMDTFEILGYESGLLKRRRERNEVEYYLQYTDGSYTHPDYNWSEIYDRYLHDRESVFIDGEYYMIDDCVRDYRNNYILKDDAIYSDYYDSYVKKRNSIEIEGIGLVDKDDVLEVYTELDSNGNLINPKKAIKSSDDSSSYVRTHNNIYIDKKIAIYNLYIDEWYINHPEHIDNRRYSVFYSISDELSDYIKTKYNLVYYNRFYLISKNLGIIESKIPIYFYYSGKYIISELTFKSLDLKEVDILEKVLYKNENYINSYKYLINYNLEEQIKILPKPEYKMEELKLVLKDIKDELYHKNNKSFKRYLNSGFTEPIDFLSYEIANIWVENNMLYKLYNGTNVLSDIKKNNLRAIYKLNNENILIDGNTTTEEFKEFIKEFEYYILLYTYIYFITRSRDFSFRCLKDLLPKDGKDFADDVIIELFTYNDTGGSLGVIINNSDLKEGFIENLIYKLDLNTRTSANVYINSFEIFYKKLKQDSKMEI